MGNWGRWKRSSTRADVKVGWKKLTLGGIGAMHTDHALNTGVYRW